METTVKRGGLKLTSIRRILKFLQVDPGPARRFVNWFIRHYGRMLEERQVRLTPAMVMLGEDICAHYILLSRRYQLLNRLESPVEPDVAPEGTQGTQGTEDQKGDTSHKARSEARREASQQSGEKSESKSREASQQAEEQSQETEKAEETKGTKGTKETKGTKVSPLPLPDLKAVSGVFDDILKLRERLRKSIGEFQSALESAGVAPGLALDEIFADGGFDEIADSIPAADTPGDTDGLPLTDIRPDVQAVQPPDATPEVIVSPMSTVSTMSTMSTMSTPSTEKESPNDDTSLEPGVGGGGPAARIPDAPIARPVRPKLSPRPERQSLVRAWLSSRVPRVESEKKGSLLGPGRGQDDRDRDPVRVGVGVPAGQADAGGGAARGASGPADAADPEHVRAKPEAAGKP